MARKSFLRLTRLEDRTTPATFGSPWTDARHLTLSFVPDGTLVDGVASNLFKTMPGQNSAWQGEILRAVQTWAQNANINVDLIVDGGQDLGTAGPLQGDARFGDVRIAARPLSDNVLAITTPSGVIGGTRTGDITLNSGKSFRIGGGTNSYDLYSVVLQEVGHAFGIANSTDPTSPMFEQYSGVRTGLAAGDVTNIKSLYGARAKDSLEGDSGNNTLSTAKELRLPSGAAANASIVAVADVTTASDVDFYKVKTQASNPNGLTIRLDASQGLLAPKLTVYAPDGTTIVGQVQSVNPQTGTLSVSLSSVQSSAYYYVKVESANSTFGVGAYQVKAVFDPNAPDAVADGSLTKIDDAHTDDTLNNPTRLNTADGYSANTHYSVLATLRDATDVDVYRLRSSRVGTNQQNTMTVNLRSLTPTALDPIVSVYNDNKQLVSAQVLVNADGSYVVQVQNAESDKDYYLMVKADAQGGGGVGDYQLDVDYRAVVVNLQDFASGTLTNTASKSNSTLTANRSQLMNFVLSTGATAAGAATAGVRMSIYDAGGHVVATLFAKAGQTVSAVTYLVTGTYTVRFDGLTQTAGATLPSLAFSLKGCTLTDPIGPTASDPTAVDYTWQKYQDDYYASMAYDPAADVLW